MWDVAVIGAGLSGLICARQLKASGYQVCVLDKSRGLGGRMATRRVSDTVRVDHGARYWQPQTDVMSALTEELLSAGVIKLWQVSAYELRANDELKPVDTAQPMYVAPLGMSAIAKHLARDLQPEDSLLNSYRATSLERCDEGWRIGCDNDKVVMATRVAIAIPAPQAADLLSTGDPTHLSDGTVEALRAVEYDPCIAILAGYKAANDMGQLDPNGWMVTDVTGTSTDWVGLDSSKRQQSVGSSATETVIVIHSKPAFAQRYLNTGDLQPTASVLLRATARKYCDWMAQPDWFQIHRWRYAQVKKAHPESVLIAAPSVVCGGDWCVSSEQPSEQPLTGLEAGYLSGQAMAITLKASQSASTISRQ